jgi:hypothetical protein
VFNELSAGVENKIYGRDQYTNPIAICKTIFSFFFFSKKLTKNKYETLWLVLKPIE